MEKYCPICEETYEGFNFEYCPKCGMKLEIQPVPTFNEVSLDEQIKRLTYSLDETISEKRNLEDHLKNLTFEYTNLTYKIANERADDEQLIEFKFNAMKTQEEIRKTEKLINEEDKKVEEISKSLETLKNKQMEEINKEKHKEFVFKKIYVAEDECLKIIYRLYAPICFEGDKTTVIKRLVNICPFEIVESDLDIIENEGVNGLKVIDVNESINYDHAIYDSIKKLNLINWHYKEKLYEDMKSIFYDEEDYELDGDYVSQRLNEIAEYSDKLQRSFIMGICPVCGFRGNATTSSRCFKCGVDLETDWDGTKKEDLLKIEEYAFTIEPLIKSFMLAKETLKHRNNQILKEKEEEEEKARKAKEEEEEIEELADTYCYENGFDKWEYYKEGILFTVNDCAEYIEYVEDKYLTEDELRSMKDELRSMKNNPGIRIRPNY